MEVKTFKFPVRVCGHPQKETIAMEVDPEFAIFGDDSVLKRVVSVMIRRRAAGFTPLLIVSVDEGNHVITDTFIDPGDVNRRFWGCEDSMNGASGGLPILVAAFRL